MKHLIWCELSSVEDHKGIIFGRLLKQSLWILRCLIRICKFKNFGLYVTLIYLFALLKTDCPLLTQNFLKPM